MPGERVDVLVRRLDPGIPLPSYAMPGDAGFDICTTIDIDLAPGERSVVPTGMALALPDGFGAFVHPRSGLAAKQGITIVNAPGTIDAGYRGEIRVCLLNTDPRVTAHLRRGDRIAQIVIQAVAVARFHEAEALPESHRGGNGYGSTGSVTSASAAAMEGN